jgi:hypothetical protein
MCLRYLDLCYVCDHITKVTCCGFIIKISNSVDGDAEYGKGRGTAILNSLEKKGKENKKGMWGEAQ